MSQDLAQQIAKRAADAAHAVATLSEQEKNAVLQKMANAIRAHKDEILKVNETDMKTGKEKGLSDAMMDRLHLTEERVEGMATAIEEIIDLKDPVGDSYLLEERPNGLKIEKMRIPLGVICMIYEARPNVTADAGALCFKSGNAVILRCGREAIEVVKLSLMHCETLKKRFTKRCNYCTNTGSRSRDRAITAKRLHRLGDSSRWRA